MRYDDPESFHELCARALEENDLETVAEIVDRILCSAASENSKARAEHLSQKARKM